MQTIMRLEFMPPSPVGQMIKDVNFDRPEPQQAVVGPIFRLAGWLLSENFVLSQILVMQGDEVVGALAVGARKDVSDAIGAPDDEVFGFDGVLSAARLGHVFELCAWGESAPGIMTPLFRIIGRRRDSDISTPAAVAPCYVVSMGRSGSTYLMSLIGQMSGMRVLGSYPYEVMHSSWLARQVESRVKLSDGEYLESDINNKDKNGPSPFYSLNYKNIDSLVGNLNASFCRNAVVAFEDVVDFYREEKEGGNDEFNYFAEKSSPGDALNLLTWVYPGAKFIFLVRNPGDVFVSRWRFRQKLENPHWDFESGRKDKVGLQDLVDDCNMMLRCSKWIDSKNHIIVKFEDLMSDEAGIVERVGQFLGRDKLKIEGEMRDRNHRFFIPPDHKTSKRGFETRRWQDELPKDIAEELSIRCASYLMSFEYNVIE